MSACICPQRTDKRCAMHPSKSPYWSKGIGNCIVCGWPAEPGTRYCSGDGGCTRKPVNYMHSGKADA